MEKPDSKTGALIHCQWQIWVSKDANGKMEVRDGLRDIPIGQVFEQAMKYCRDEGWDRVEIFRIRTGG